MATFFYQSNYSTQRYLGERQLCPCCKGSKIKGDFKLFSGQVQCLDCIEEALEDMGASEVKSDLREVTIN